MGRNRRVSREDTLAPSLVIIQSLNFGQNKKRRRGFNSAPVSLYSWPLNMEGERQKRATAVLAHLRSSRRHDGGR